jgi:hypothetical protein
MVRLYQDYQVKQYGTWQLTPLAALATKESKAEINFFAKAQCSQREAM